MKTETKTNNILTRAAMMLVLMLLTATAWAQGTIYLSLQPNDGSEAGTVVPVNCDITGKYSYKLSPTYFTRENHTIKSWATSPTGGGTQYGADATIELTGPLTLYAIWDDMPYVGALFTEDYLTYRITSISPNTVQVVEYSEQTLNYLIIPSTVTYGDLDFSVTSIKQDACAEGSRASNVSIPASVTYIGSYAFWKCQIPGTVTISGNPQMSEYAFPKDMAVRLNLTANTADGAYWTTFCNFGYNFQADENTTVYKGTVSGSSVVLTEVEDRIVNCGTAVILKSMGTPMMTMTTTSSIDTNDNDLRGISERLHRTDFLTGSLAGGTLYVMGKKGSDFGFFEYTAHYMPANKAFLIIEGGAALSRGLTMVYGDETGIETVSDVRSQMSDDWYTLDGRKLDGKPTVRGIYVNNGQKIIIK